VFDMTQRKTTISSLLLIAWLAVLAGPAVVPVQEAVAGLFTEETAADCCGAEAECACDMEEMSCSMDDAEAEEAPCLRLPVLFSGLALTAGSFSLDPNRQGRLRSPRTGLTPEQIAVSTLDPPPKYA
jgi:hypothetical protein